MKCPKCWDSLLDNGHPPVDEITVRCVYASKEKLIIRDSRVTVKRYSTCDIPPGKYKPEGWRNSKWEDWGKEEGVTIVKIIL